MLDIDFFSQVNDTYGHAAGDAALRDLGSRLTSLVRATDIVGRLGGEEFGVVLPGHSPSGATNIAERLRLSSVESILQHDPAFKITASFGAASLMADIHSFEQWMGCADHGLYTASAVAGTVAASANVTSLRYLNALIVAPGIVRNHSTGWAKGT